MPEKKNMAGPALAAKVDGDLSSPSIIRLSDRETHFNEPKEKENLLG